MLIVQLCLCIYKVEDEEFTSISNLKPKKQSPLKAFILEKKDDEFLQNINSVEPF